MLFPKFAFSVFSVKLWNQTNPICLDKGDFNKVLETELFEITQGNNAHYYPTEANIVQITRETSNPETFHTLLLSLIIIVTAIRSFFLLALRLVNEALLTQLLNIHGYYTPKHLTDDVCTRRNHGQAQNYL